MIYHAVLTVFIATAFAFGLFYVIRLNPWKSETKAVMKCNALQFFGKPVLATDIVNDRIVWGYCCDMPYFGLVGDCF